ncbi:MAG: tetratricopeptide repeat protein, partial [Candidatus Neomarinimicrobiota bacterium]
MTFRRELKERRVIPLVGLYLGASWVGVEFLGFLTDRYLLSPYLIDLVLLTLGAMLPSVLALAWTHGKPGRDEWTRLEQVVVPVNVLLVASVLVILFQGKELGGTTRMVTAEDETGARIERVIPKAGFRKQLALYFFANASGLPEAEWVTMWLPQAVYLDLIQDFYFDNRSPFQLALTMTEAGAELGAAPLALQREIARQLHLPYFLAGEVQAVAPYAIETRLYQTRRGRLIASHRYQGDDLGAIIDRLSVGIKEDLEIAATDIEEAEDLPVSAISSEDPRALAWYVDGMMQLRFHRDWQEAARSLTRAVELDASFALAQFYLYQANLLLGNESADAIDAAMSYLYKVPERLQGAIKEVYYTWRGEPEKALAALRLDVTLSPNDVIAHRRLANFYRKTAFYPEALKQFELIQELNPGDDLVLRDIAGIHGALGRFKQAVASLRAYLGNNPRDVEALLELGEIYQLLGRTGNAEEVYARAALLGPQAARVMVQRADLHFQMGAYREALALALEASDAALSLEVKLRALNELAAQYEA